MCPPVRFPAQNPLEAVGAVINRQIDSAAMAACHNAPPILFLAAQKRECAAPGGREKGAWRAPAPSCLRARRGSAYRCLLRFRLAFGHAIIFCEFATAVP